MEILLGYTAYPAYDPNVTYKTFQEACVAGGGLFSPHGDGRCETPALGNYNFTPSMAWFCSTDGRTLLTSNFTGYYMPPDTIGSSTGACPDGPKHGGRLTCRDCNASNPIAGASLNKYHEEVVYKSSGPEPALAYTLHYNSIYYGAQRIPHRGLGMRSTFDKEFYVAGYNSDFYFIGNAIRDDGKSYRFFRFASAPNLLPDNDVYDRVVSAYENSVHVGYDYTEASTENVERFGLSGRLEKVSTRSGVQQILTYSDANTPSAVAPVPGLLIKVEDSFGRTLNFTYNAQQRMVSMTDPAGGVYTFSYSTEGSLTDIAYPDGRTKTFHYEIPGKPQLMTGISDENGSRFTTYTYTDVYAIRSERAGGVNRMDFTYNANGTVTIADALGGSSTYAYISILGVPYNTDKTSPSHGTGPWKKMFWDTRGNLVTTQDWLGFKRYFAFDLNRGLETGFAQGYTAADVATPAANSTVSQWHPVFRLKTGFAEPLRRTTWIYNGDGGVQCGFKADGVTLVPGVLCRKTEQATNDPTGTQGFSSSLVGTPRIWNFTYNQWGQVLSVDGPRTDVPDLTTYAYSVAGNLISVTNALGQATQITSHNAHGQPLTIVDPNGLVTTLAYDSRQRLISRSVGGETTSYEYDGVGQLVKVTLPDLSFLSYTYDAAHRLTAIQDNLGNRIAYTLDLLGNRTKEDAFDPSNTLAQTRSRVYSSLNRLFREIGALGQTTEFTYDLQGNVISSKDPLNRVTANAYDALHRLTQVTDPANGTTKFGYNNQNRLTQVTDPRNLATAYTVTGLGDLSQQVSPDTGTTSSVYDIAGNVVSQTDAKGQVTTYAYDALNRPVLITFHDGVKHALSYDQGANGIGRLTAITETSAANAVTSQIAYAYDVRGRVTSETRTLAGVPYVTGYAYDSAGRMSGVTYPGGRTVSYGFDALGRVNQVSTSKDSVTQVVVQNVQYHPFGGVKSWTMGNGQIYARSIDLDGRIGAYSLGSASHVVGFDAASRITGIAQAGNPANANTYGYDALDLLTPAVLPNNSHGYGYDAVGNRLTKTTGTNTDTYAYGATSNRLATITPASGPVRSVVMDANGSTTNDAVNQFGYDARGRMIQATTAQGATGYQVNALGQRVRKTDSANDVLYHYDTGGRLIAETSSTGEVQQEYLYLGDVPVAVVR